MKNNYMCQNNVCACCVLIEISSLNTCTNRNLVPPGLCVLCVNIIVFNAEMYILCVNISVYRVSTVMFSLQLCVLCVNSNVFPHQLFAYGMSLERFSQ